MDLSEKIKCLMKEQKLNQKQLADKAQITEASMSKYLSGARQPRSDVVIKLARALGTSVNYLLDECLPCDKPYIEAQTSLARCKDKLSDDEKKRLIKFLLED